MKAWVGLRPGLHYRRDAFQQGLEALGYTVIHEVTTKPGPKDVLVIWNRYRNNARAADAFEARGRPVLVAENASWGNEFAGKRWYQLAANGHNTADRFHVGGPERWDSLGVDLPAWRTGSEVVILPQRGIGPPGTAMPLQWPQNALRLYGGRIRNHPGTQPCRPLEDDLEDCGLSVTWGSGAAIKALAMGVQVKSEMPNWIGQQDNTDSGRLAMFRRLAWAQFTLEEIRTGYAFSRFLT